MIEVISNSLLNSKPSKTLLALPLLKVTKSPTAAPFALSVTVTIGLPLTVVKGLVKEAVSRIGVISKIAPSEYKYNFLSVPKARYLVPFKLIHECVSRITPITVRLGLGRYDQPFQRSGFP